MSTSLESILKYVELLFVCNDYSVELSGVGDVNSRHLLENTRQQFYRSQVVYFYSRTLLSRGRGLTALAKRKATSSLNELKHL